MLQLKPWGTRGVSHHLAFMGNYYSHVFSLIHPVNEFSFKEMRMWFSSRFYLVVFVFDENQINYKAGEHKIPNTNGGKSSHRFSCSYRKLLDRVAFRMLSNINDGALLQKYAEHL